MTSTRSSAGRCEPRRCSITVVRPGRPGPVGNLLSRTHKTEPRSLTPNFTMEVSGSPIGRDVDAEFFAHGKYRDVFAQHLSFDDSEGDGGLATPNGYDS
jgi:hypothetical protein